MFFGFLCFVLFLPCERPDQVVWQEFVEVCGPLDWKNH